MPDDTVNPNPAPAPNADQPTAGPAAPPQVDAGQPQPNADAAPKPTTVELSMPGGTKQQQDWSDPVFQKEVAENYWKFKTFDKADERRMRRAVRKDNDVLLAALRGEENADHPLATQIKE